MEKIDLKSVKIALERDEMLEVSGGSYSCDSALGLCGLTFVLTGGTPLGWGVCAIPKRYANSG